MADVSTLLLRFSRLRSSYDLLLAHMPELPAESTEKTVLTTDLNAWFTAYQQWYSYYSSEEGGLLPDRTFPKIIGQENEARAQLAQLETELEDLWRRWAKVSLKQIPLIAQNRFYGANAAGADDKDSSGFPWVVVGALVIVVGGAVAYWALKRK